MSKERNRVCHVSTVHESTDDRIFLKQCRSLAAAGFEVHMVINHVHDDSVEGIHIHALKKRNSRWQRILFGLPEAMTKTLRTRARIVQLHDPELLVLAPIFRIAGRKVIFDSHENVPLQILSKEWIGSKTARRFIASIYRLAEKFFVLFCHRVISVTQEITERFPPHKRLLVRNYPILSLALPWRGHEGALPVLIYAGGLTGVRGIMQCIDALEILSGRATLQLLGPWGSEEFEKECMQRPGWKYVQYLGKVRPEEVFDFYSKADIALAMMQPEANIVASLPVKAFEYMAASLPVVMSDFPYWRQHFGGHAIFVHPPDATHLANALEPLLSDATARRQLGRNGSQYVMENYSWEKESEILIAAYKELTGGDKAN